MYFAYIIFIRLFPFLNSEFTFSGSNFWSKEEFGLCQQLQNPSSISSASTCFVNKKSLKFSKIERINESPPILHFRQVFSKNFVEILLRRLEKMKLEQMITVQSTDQSMRQANGTWIRHEETHEFAALLSALQNLLPLFDLRRSEPFQVINYDRGGHYAPHYDYPTDEKTKKLMEKRGNRIATVIVVLKRAEKGGGLVFTDLKTSLLPQVGDVILWFNMTSRHQLEYLSKHAACPVERGKKIVISLWIRSKGQEFTLRSRNGFENGFDLGDFNN